MAGMVYLVGCVYFQELLGCGDVTVVFTSRNFWDVVMGLNKNMQKRLLRFTTGSDRIPIGGMKEMQFKITRVGDVAM